VAAQAKSTACLWLVAVAGDVAGRVQGVEVVVAKGYADNILVLQCWYAGEQGIGIAVFTALQQRHDAILVGRQYIARLREDRKVTERAL
jgi:hypothetical protein